MRRRWVLAIIVVAVLAAVWISHSVANRKAFVARGALASPAADQVSFSGNIPKHPFRLQAGNVLSRTVFQTAASSDSRVEIRDLVMPARARSHLEPLPGPTVLDVYSGEVTLTVGNGEGEHLTSHALRSVPAGQPLIFENPGTYPVVLRLYVFEAK